MFGIYKTSHREVMGKEYTIGLYEKAMPKDLTWAEKLQIAKEVGYDFMELSIDESEEKIERIYMSKEARFNLVQCMYEVGLPIGTMCVSALTKYSLGNEDEALCGRGMEIAQKAIELAADLGVRIVMIPGYDVYYGESTASTQARYLENLRNIAMVAAKYGVLVELETMENSFMNTVWKAMYYVKQINSLYLGIYPDVGNVKNAAVLLGHDEYKDLYSGMGHISSIHLKETVPGKFREIEYGTGHVDFERVIQTAWSIGVRKYVTEFWYTGNENWREMMKKAYNMADEILERQQ